MTSATAGLKDSDDKKRNKGTKAKDLASLDAATAAGVDQPAPTNPAASAPGETKPPAAADAPISKADRFKQAFANGDAKADPSASSGSDLPLLPEKPSARSNAASLRLDHAEAVKADPETKAASAIPDKANAAKPGAARPDSAKPSQILENSATRHSAAQSFRPRGPMTMAGALKPQSSGTDSIRMLSYVVKEMFPCPAP